jgi:hypothetical protein
MFLILFCGVIGDFRERLGRGQANEFCTAAASIMPCVTTGHTVGPCVVIGEQAAAFLKPQRGLGGRLSLPAPLRLFCHFSRRLVRQVPPSTPTLKLLPGLRGHSRLPAYTARAPLRREYVGALRIRTVESFGFVIAAAEACR